MSSRYRWKFRLIKALYARGRTADQVRMLFRFIDWLIDLPPELGKQLADQIVEYEKENQMPYVTSVEKSGIEQGIEQGLRAGILAVLELRFPGEYHLLENPLANLHSAATLSEILQASKTVASLEELRGLIR